MKQNILEMKNIVKSFGPVTVLHDVNFNVQQGEVHALVGANGAGKSTLMKILNGIYTTTSGSVFLNGEEVHFNSPKDAYQGGVSMIHQELDLVGNLSVAENIFLGREMTKGGRVDRASMFREAQELLDSLSFEIDARAEAGKLSTAKQQLILIARTFSLKSNLIVMDEPTSSLSHTETQALFKIIDMLKERGISVIYISHYLEEIFSVADRVTVLRNGEVIVTKEIGACTEQQIVEWMVGHSVERHQVRKKDFSDKATVLRIEGLSQKQGLVKDISLSLREGEVIGLAGVVGAGRTELLKMIYGALETEGGRMWLNEKEFSIDSPTKAVAHLVGLVPEDRKLEGLAVGRSISANLALAELKDRSAKGFLKHGSIRKFVNSIVERFHIKCTSPAQLISDLSGGNQQKVVIGKWLSGRFKIILFDQPTRGVDVGAKSEIYQMIHSLADENVAMIIASDEIEELMDMCDRIIVLKKGRMVHEFDNAGENPTKADILEKMVG